MLSNSGRYRDRNPDLRAAGKLFNLGDTAKSSLTAQDRPHTPEVVYKYHCTTQPAPGKPRIFYGRYSDPGIASLLTHGVNTKPSLVAGDLVNPRPKSIFAQRLGDKRESIYHSRQRAPLGCSHDQSVGLPGHVSQYQTSFGLKTFKDCTAGELVNPTKTHRQVEDEAIVGHDIYKISHSAYHVGETYDRKYDWTTVPKSSCFGVETPHDNRGHNVRRTLKWLAETQREKSAHIVSKRVDNFQERTQPQVGKCHDPIKDTLNVAPDHTFGIMIKPDDYGAGDLIHMRKAGGFLRGRERERGVLAAIRQHLKKANYHNFDHLKAAFEYYDKNKSGKIDINELRDICVQFNVPVQEALLEELLDYCDVDRDGLINYAEFANFLNWKDKLPSGYDENLNQTEQEGATDGESEQLKADNSLGDLRKQVDASVVELKTSSSDIDATLDKLPREEVRTYGVPTIRSDLPAPRIRRIGDSKNYGDESDAYGLINPSMYSNKGIYERDFFQGRDKHDIRRIFDSIGVEVTTDTFEQLWEEARSRNPNGEVSVQSFKEIVEEAMDGEESTEEPAVDVSNTLNFVTSNKPEIYNKVNELYNKQKSPQANQILEH